MYLYVFYKVCNNDILFFDLDGNFLEKFLKVREFFGLWDFYRLLNYENYFFYCFMCCFVFRESGRV